MNICQYCHTDSDGYITLLPRLGIGNADIYVPAHGNPYISVRSPNRCQFQIPIEHCPKCGRSLLKERDSNEA